MPTIIQCAIAQTLRGQGDMQSLLDMLYAVLMAEIAA